MAPFYVWCSTVSTVYFLSLILQELLVLIWSATEGWEAEWTLERPGSIELFSFCKTKMNNKN